MEDFLLNINSQLLPTKERLECIAEDLKDEGSYTAGNAVSVAADQRHQFIAALRQIHELAVAGLDSAHPRNSAQLNAIVGACRSAFRDPSLNIKAIYDVP